MEPLERFVAESQISQLRESPSGAEIAAIHRSHHCIRPLDAGDRFTYQDHMNRLPSRLLVSFIDVTVAHAKWCDGRAGEL